MIIIKLFLIYFYFSKAHLCKVNKIFTTLAKIRKEMKAEREIAGITLPFAAGAIVSVYLGMVLFSSPLLTAVLPFLAIIATSAYLLYSGAKVPIISGKIAIATVMTACGWICGVTGSFLAVSQITCHGWLEGIAFDLCSQTETMIESIPFHNDETSQIIKALITGEKSGIPESIKDAFRASGASHILALSGLHLGIIYGILRGLLFFFGNSSTAKGIST